jgi:hypothetical protein
MRPAYELPSGAARQQAGQILIYPVVDPWHETHQVVSWRLITAPSVLIWTAIRYVHL